MVMQTSPELAIRMARAAFNRALAAADLAAIGPLLAPDVVLVAGTDSAVITGRKAQLQAWKHEFAARARSVYSRIPETVIVSPVAPIAFEHGQWQGVAAADGAVQASGSYTAKWREIGGAWVIEAELYLTLA
jgi:ketosteroid isomerase-like protein